MSSNVAEGMATAHSAKWHKGQRLLALVDRADRNLSRRATQRIRRACHVDLDDLRMKIRSARLLIARSTPLAPMRLFRVVRLDPAQITAADDCASPLFIVDIPGKCVGNALFERAPRA
jgi:hypothetical protein